MAKSVRPLTDKQRFALRAVEKGIVRRVLRKFGWRTVANYYAWDSDITDQVRSLMRVHRLIRFTRDGNGGLELRQKESTR
jgi:hypothetical protein